MGRAIAAPQNMILLSYSTLNELINEPHTWACKQMGLPRKTFYFMTQGTEAHGVIQRHISGVQKDPRLTNITVEFPVVETQRQDPATHFEAKIDDEYSIHGYMDGKDEAHGRGLEIKTSSNPWGLAKFMQLPQWKMAALAQPWLKEMWFITCTRDLKNPVTFNTPVTENHKQQALDFVTKGIEIIKSGDFSYNGIGRSRYCNYIDCPYCG